MFMEILRPLLAFAAGSMIGLMFGLVQNAALRRNEQRQREGKLNNGWSLMPGSGARIAYFLIVLVIIQFLCPLLFTNGTQWWISGGVLAGYGFVLYRQLRQRLAQNK